MQIRDVLGFVLIPLGLLAAAWVMNSYRLWSFLGNMTMPWLCSAVAVSLLLLGAVCFVLQVSPGGVPAHVALVVVPGMLVIYGVGMIVDAVAYGVPPDWPASIGGWVGFALILSVVFYVGRATAGIAE